MLLNLLGTNAGFLGRVRYFFWIRNRSLTVRATFITLCLALTLITTLLLDKSIILGFLPLVGVLGISVVLFIYYDLERSLLLILLVTMFLHDGIGTGTGTKITFTFALLALTGGIWLFKMLMVERTWGIHPSSANLPGAVFIAVVIFAAIWSDVFVEPAARFVFNDKLNPRIMTLVSLILAPLAYFLFANKIRSTQALRNFVWIFIIAGAVFLAMHLGGFSFIRGIFNSNGQFGAWVTVLALGQAVFNKNYKPYVKVILIIISLGWLYQTLGLGITWLSGWLPVVLGAGVIIFLRSRRITFLILIVAAAFLFINKHGITQTFDAENSESGGTRSAAWAEVLGITKDHLLFGTGPAGYYMYYIVRNSYANLSHNNYVDIIAQTGVVGIMVYLWFWASVGWMALRTYRRAPRGGFYQGLAAALLAANLITFVSMMLGDWVTPFAYTQGIAGIDYTIWHWMMAGLTVALYYQMPIAQENAPSAEKVNPHELALSNPI